MSERRGWWADLALGLLASVVLVGVIVVLHGRVGPAGAQAAASEQSTGPVAFQRADRGPTRVLFVGDALADQFPALVMTELGRGGPVTSEQAASPAATAGSAVRVPDSLNLAVVELGANDVGRTPLPSFRSEYAALLGQIRAGSSTTALVCAGSWHAGAEAFDAVIERECVSHGGAYVPLTDYFAAAAAGRWSATQSQTAIAGRIVRTVATLQG